MPLEKLMGTREFGANLKRELEAREDSLSEDERKILVMVRARPSLRKWRRLRAMENHARGAIGIDPEKSVVDWLKDVDWAKVFQTVMKVLMALLPLLLAL